MTSVLAGIERGVKAAKQPQNIRVRLREVPQINPKEYKRVGVLSSKTGIPEAYLTTITSKALQCVVSSVVQQKINFLVNGIWEPYPGMGMINEFLDLIPQALFGVTLVQPWMKRRQWRGSTPIKITLTLRFEAIDDAINDVVAPCMYLQMMTLPQEAGRLEYVEQEGTANESREHLLSVYSPPGPTPFSVFEDPILGGDKINITIGKFLHFDNVIVTECDLEIASRFTSDGFPISATANVVFETYEMMTKEKLHTVYEYYQSVAKLPVPTLGKSYTIPEVFEKITGKSPEEARDLFKSIGKNIPGVW